MTMTMGLLVIIIVITATAPVAENATEIATAGAAGSIVETETETAIGIGIEIGMGLVGSGSGSGSGSGKGSGPNHASAGRVRLADWSTLRGNPNARSGGGRSRDRGTMIAGGGRAEAGIASASPGRAATIGALEVHNTKEGMRGNVDSVIQLFASRSTWVEPANSITYADTTILGPNSCFDSTAGITVRYSSELSGRSDCHGIWYMRVLRVATRKNHPK
jgi:hypothetical protein